MELNELLPERIRKEYVMHLKPKKKQMLIALDTCLGVVANAARKASIDRATHYRWLERDPDYKMAVEAVMKVTFEWDEAIMMKYLEQNQLKILLPILSAQGMSRGYRMPPRTKVKVEPVTANVILSEPEAIEMMKRMSKT
ncbi:MAG: hypothetical protein ACLQQ4_15910 [Bacteroidia bacterium]